MTRRGRFFLRQVKDSIRADGWMAGPDLGRLRNPPPPLHMPKTVKPEEEERAGKRGEAPSTGPQ